MKFSPLNGDSAVLEEVGRRLAETRLEQNRSQESIATAAGVSRRTIIRMEAGEDVSLATFVRVIRELGLIQNLEQLLPEAAPSPIERLKTEGKRRRRAS